MARALGQAIARRRWRPSGLCRWLGDRVHVLAEPRQEARAGDVPPRQRSSPRPL